MNGKILLTLYQQNIKVTDFIELTIMYDFINRKLFLTHRHAGPVSRTETIQTLQGMESASPSQGQLMQKVVCSWT